VLTGGYSKTLAGAPGSTGTQKLIIATNDEILVADADIPSSFDIPNIPNTRGIFAGTLTAGDITRLKTYAVAEGAVDDDFAGITNFATYFRDFDFLLTIPSSLDTSSGTIFNSAWEGCSSLTSFPLLDTSSGTSFFRAWRDCSGLTSFSALDVSSGINFFGAWRRCSSLTSFPLLDVSSANDFKFAWRDCSSLATFPANFFDGCSATEFTDAFTDTALNQTSIDNILVSINSNGTSNGTFNQSGGSAPSATGEAAIDALRGRGWTVTVTGGY
jgi:hypothetical protein